MLPLAAAVVANLVANGVVAYTWREVVAISGPRMPLRVAAWIWGSSQLARYTLGGAQVGGRAVIGREYGLTLSSGGTTAIVEILWQLCLNAVVIVATLPWWLPGAGQLRWLAAVAALPAALLVWLVAHPSGLLGVARRAIGCRPVAWPTRGRLDGTLDRITLTRIQAARLTGLYAGNLALRFVAFLIVLAAVAGTLSTIVPRAAGAFTLGHVVGWLAVFAPGGVGPREGVTALILTPSVGAAPAVLLVAVVRLTELVGELLFVAVARLARPS